MYANVGRSDKRLRIMQKSTVAAQQKYQLYIVIDTCSEPGDGDSWDGSAILAH